ncbi:glycogen debranching N-terminal domain-containing protein [Lentzea sp. NPDC004782]|uniref:amylo-alpha-1,6-glucosidase n=1 Tax=Lentzea sp. NPDC004782 TaxID=3154458 RepID=UPI0033AA7EC6
MTEGPAPTALNAGEPVMSHAGHGTVTLVDGSTFCLSNSTGDVEAGTSHGLFYRDARMVSRWELRLDGQPPHALSVVTPEAFAARFMLRRPPKPGQADSTLLVVRERLLGDGLRETITLHNLGREATAVSLSLHVDADFADLFAVKEGRTSGGGADATVVGAELLLWDRSRGARGLSVSASAEPTVLPGELVWRIVVPPRQLWTTEIVVQPTVANLRVQPRFHPGEHIESSGPARTIQAWRDASTTIEADDVTLDNVLRRSERDLGALQIRDPSLPDKPFVAAGAPWFMTLFGRDSLLTAWMALPLDTGLALGTLQTLADKQGRRVDPVTEEEPGRILHELRLGPDSNRVLGGSHYYGTVDATPLFVALLGECWRWGADEAEVRALLPAADAALEWIDRSCGAGFLAYRRSTDVGLINQGWKDSFDGINDAAGRTVSSPIALCEVQGYVYAAWLARAELAEAFGDTDTAVRLREQAEKLRHRFAEAFWLPDRGWYAVALDGRGDPVDALTSNAAQCLWSGIVPDEHAAVLVDRLASEDMDTGYGLRTLAANMGAYNPMSYHNGSVWPHDTALAVAGLLRYAHIPGAVELAQRLACGLLDAASAFGGRLPELFCGFARAEFSPPVPYPTSCSPQAWASAAPLLLVRSFLGLRPHVPSRSLELNPHLPSGWGAVRLADLRLGNATLQISATGEHATVSGVPDGWTLQGRCQAHDPMAEPEHRS